MNLFGGGGSKVKPQYTGLATQTSTSVIGVAIGMGKNRAAPNIIYQTDFQSHAQKQKTGKGGGSQTVGYTYSGTYILSLGWGVAGAVTKVWKDQSKETSYSALGFTFIPGTIPQDPWGYLTTNHPSEALGYPGLALMCVPNYDLGQTNALSQHSFEVEWQLCNTAPGGVGDADPAQCVDLLLNSTVFGALLGQPAMVLDNLLSTGAAPTTGDAAFQTYCQAMGFGMSPLLDSPEPGLEILKRWTTIFNTALVWTGYSLFFSPYGAETVTGNGVTYLPDTASQFDLGDDDFKRQDGEDPVKVRRKSPEDCWNFVPLEIRNRSNEYNVEPAGIPDQGLVDQFGLKAQSAQAAREICEPAIGAVCAALVQQRQAYVRNEFDFTVGPQFMLILPGAIGTITDPKFGTQSVRIINILENEDGDFDVTAEEYAGSVSSPGPNTPQDPTNNPVDTNVAPGPVNAPIIFEPPSTLAGPSPQVWMAVSGGNGTVANPNWGGCFVWLSTDNVTYQQVGQIDGAARMGLLTGSGLASYGGANPDTTNSCPVNLAMSQGELQGVTAADAANAITISVIKDAGGTLEFLSYRDATLTGTFAYTLGGQLYRKLYGTAAAAHAAGAHFARLDENIFKFALPASFIGQTIYAKFQSFNIFGSGVEDLAGCAVYSYVPLGTGFGGGTAGVPTTPATPTISAPAGYNFLTWAANPTSDNVTRYDVYRATGLSQPFGSASLIGSASGTSYTDGTAASGQGYTYFIKAVNSAGSSSASAGANITTATASSNVLRFYGSIDGKPDAGEELFDIEMLGGEVFDAGFPANLGGCDVAPTGSVTFPIKQAGSTVGSMNIAAGATVATWTLASGLSFTAGQRFSFYAPTTQDPTLSGPRYTFAGRR